MPSNLRTKEKYPLIHFEKIQDKGDSKKEVLVSVTDTGSRIKSEIFGRLFSKFASKSYQGTGLGLFICKGIIQAHGGRIWAENNNNINGNGDKDSRGLLLHLVYLLLLMEIINNG